MRLFHRKTEHWEVVDHTKVVPVSTYSEDERHDMQITKICGPTLCGHYLFECKEAPDLRRAVVFAQQKLLKDVADKGFNVYLTEGWSVTRMRKGNQERAHVCYRGRPALASGETPEPRLPPFLGILGK